jgi:hypothetical protein
LTEIIAVKRRVGAIASKELVLRHLYYWSIVLIENTADHMPASVSERMKDELALLDEVSYKTTHPRT